MRAVRLQGPGAGLRLADVPVPEPTGSEVRIRVAGCGVCHTDLHIVDGVQARVDFPLILGHEVAGWVDAIGPDAEGVSVGDAVLVYGGWGCGACRECASGAEQRCPTGRSPGFQADGGYAEFMVVPHPRHLVPLGSLDAVHAAPLADAGLTPYRAVRRAEPWLRPGARVLVIGAGGLGQFAIQYLRLLPIPDLAVAVSELSPARMERAKELGAEAGLIGDPVDVVMDFVGSDETLALAGGVVAPDGLVMLVGEGGGELRFGFEHPAVESWVTTTAWGSVEELREVVRLAQAGRLRWDTDAMPLEDAESAHQRVRDGEASGRIVLVPGAAP
jgi:propanol-preferring alcohol dehydrogenase